MAETPRKKHPYHQLHSSSHTPKTAQSSNDTDLLQPPASLSTRRRCGGLAGGLAGCQDRDGGLAKPKHYRRALERQQGSKFIPDARPGCWTGCEPWGHRREGFRMMPVDWPARWLAAEHYAMRDRNSQTLSPAAMRIGLSLQTRSGATKAQDTSK